MNESTDLNDWMVYLKRPSASAWLLCLGAEAKETSVALSICWN